MLTSDGVSTNLPPLVVAGAFQTGVVLMRNLKRRGVETYCIDCNTDQGGFRTVYGKAFACPNPDTDPEGWARFMVDLAGRIGRRPVLIPSADQFVQAIAAHAAALEPHYTFLPASMAVQALLATKKRQYEIAGSNGLPVPRTAFVQSRAEVAQFAASAQFPCLIKPVHFREWEKLPDGHALLNQKIALAATPAELEAQYRSVEQVTPDVVIQEIIEGPDTAKMVYLACYGRGGRRLGACIVRQMRTTPINFGSASLVEPMSDPETDAICDGFLRSVHYEGICELELKRDTRDGRVKLIEANPRYSVTADAAPYAGVDIGWLHYCDLIGEKVEPVTWHGRHFHHIVIRRDVQCFRDYLKAGLLTWGGLFQSYRGAYFFDLDFHDRRIAMDTLKHAVKVILYPLKQRLFPKRR